MQYAEQHAGQGQSYIQDSLCFGHVQCSVTFTGAALRTYIRVENCNQGSWRQSLWNTQKSGQQLGFFVSYASPGNSESFAVH